MNDARTHYEVLGVRRDASADEIRRAWKTLIQVWHPDRFTGLLRAEAEEMTKAINDAYQVLSKPHSRAQHDAEFQARPRSDPRQDGAGPEDYQSPPAPHRRNNARTKHPTEEAKDAWAKRAAKGAALMLLAAIFIASASRSSDAEAGLLVTDLIAPFCFLWYVKRREGL